jgi:nicotinic acid mononucleotide adenylyltransferase
MQRPDYATGENISFKQDLLSNINSNMAPNLYNFYTTKDEFNAIVGPEMDEKDRLFLLSKLARSENDSECINLTAFRDIISNSAMGNLWFIKNRVTPVSSSMIRQQVKTGTNISEWVPKVIYDYIYKHQLYTK